MQYAGGCLLALLFVMFFIGETRGRTLEECVYLVRAPC